MHADAVVSISTLQMINKLMTRWPLQLSRNETEANNGASNKVLGRGVSSNAAQAPGFGA
jgi:hypothetical protein